MPSLLGIDWGSKKVGLATVDEGHWLVSPQPSYTRQSNSPRWKLDKKDQEHLQGYIDDYDVVRFVLGLPKKLDGGENSASQETRKLAEQIQKLFNRPVSLVNEALSSWESAGAADDNAQAAVTILEDYLAQEKRKAQD